MATEKRLIDAYKLEKLVEGHRGAYFHRDDIVAAIAAQPTVDAVEVVRCKECKSWEQYNACDGTKPHRCMNHDAIFHKRTAPDDFCSYGERRS